MVTKENKDMKLDQITNTRTFLVLSTICLSTKRASIPHESPDNYHRVS